MHFTIANGAVSSIKVCNVQEGNLKNEKNTLKGIVTRKIMHRVWSYFMKSVGLNILYSEEKE